ncbi:hypothetical protein PRIPAC_92085 [Pristionchus pacificus]|uniref:G protein-coupled receptor n=1 Tax=Pristionchus pacificus TaxID=54126 RepID=A0A2A6CDQ2_PRIPA|nr:hypothetical protein PRIPAC_92085 [Pristionchus pacificus]|eukprot:PDM76239.1 G protein-coupled receptor [Pristionchus pacificus]
MYPLYPWPGFYCDGLICRLIPDVQPWVLMLLSAFAIISVVPCFQYLTFRVYSNVVSVADARFYVGQRPQLIILIISNAILGANVVAFGILGQEPEYVKEIYATPEISTLLRKRGGRVVIFGRPGDPGTLIYEIYLIFVSVLLVLPVICIMMMYARRVIRKREHLVSTRTHKVEDRLAKVFFIQIVSVIIFYCVPIVTLLGLMVMDTTTWPTWLLAIIRPMLMLLLTLKSTVQSMIFLLKNPIYAKILHAFAKQKCKVDVYDIAAPVLPPTANPTAPKQTCDGTAADKFCKIDAANQAALSYVCSCTA